MSSIGSPAVRSAAERAARARAVRRHQGVLARVAVWPAEWREGFEERAAIAEHLGGLQRAEAEALAAELVQAEFCRCTARGPPARP